VKLTALVPFAVTIRGTRKSKCFVPAAGRPKSVAEGRLDVMVTLTTPVRV